MFFDKIDLYNYFNLKKPQNAKGVLTIMVRQNLSEVSTERLRPAMLIMPGGGYSFVSQREASPIAYKYLNAGFNAFILDYSVHPLAYPTQLVEAAMAMVYIRENAVKLNIDGDKVAAIGFSAGGHLCASMATIFDDENIVKTLGTERAKLARPDAVIISYAVISSDISIAHIGSFNNLCGSDENLKEKMSLEKRVSKNAVPAFIWHTLEDGAVPVQNSLKLAESYIANGVPCELHIFEKGWHGLSTVDNEVYPVSKQVDFTCKEWISLSINWLNSRNFKIKD